MCVMQKCLKYVMNNIVSSMFVCGITLLTHICIFVWYLQDTNIFYIQQQITNNKILYNNIICNLVF